MASLNVRNLPERVQQRLRVQAAKAGRSMEAEAREILSVATRSEGSSTGVVELQAFVDRLYGHAKPTGVVDALINDRRHEAEIE